MMRVIRKNLRPFSAIIVLTVVGLAVAANILSNQGARFPLLDEQPVRMVAVLETAQAVTPGQGQTVQVAGVQVGKIAAVDLVDGRAHVGLDIEPEYVEEGLVRTDARALLRPRTPLKDMYIQLLPGSREAPAAREGFTIPVDRTLPDVDLDEILAQLDKRTTDYVKLLLVGADEGLRERGGDLAAVFEAYRPTARDLARVNRAVAGEQRALKRLVTSLSRLNGRLARNPRALSQLVSASESTFSAFAAEDDNLRATVAELPATLRQATATLRDVGPLARELGPATRALTPALRALDQANRRIRPAARRTLAPVRDQIRPFVRSARPVVADLRPTATELGKSFPELRRGATVLNRFFNMLGFNRDGREGPEDTGRDEGYLYWLAWTAHNGANLINVDDENGPMRPIFLTGLCGTLTSLVNNQPGLEFAMGLSPLLAGICGDPATRSTNTRQALRVSGFDAKGRRR